MTDLSELRYNYALEWFKYHAQQRYSGFHVFVQQLFLAPLGFAVSLAAKPQYATNYSFWFVFTVGFGIASWMCYLFYLLDRRNEKLVKLGEAVLTECEEWSLFHGVEPGKVSGILLADSSDDPEHHGWRRSHKKLMRVIFGTSIGVFAIASLGSLWMAVSLWCETAASTASTK